MEDKMNALKSLTFTALPSQGGNPILERRAKVIARLEAQKLILRDPNYTRTNRKWVKKDGERVMIEQQQRVPLWWRQHPSGSYALFVRSGLKPVEFEKGKPAIAVSSLDKLPSVIDTLITAVRNGELDQQFADSSKQTRESRRERLDEGKRGSGFVLLPLQRLEAMSHDCRLTVGIPPASMA
jgi:hypothetical protein